MSDGDEDADAGESADEASGAEAGESEAEAPALDPETFEERLDDAADELEAAETESDLDDVEATLDGIESDLEAADLPEPDDEDETPPAEQFADRLDELRTELEEQRGPYPEDLAAEVTAAGEQIADTRWTERGEAALRAAVAHFLAETNSVLDDLADRVDPVAVDAARADDVGDEDDEGADPAAFVTAVDAEDADDPDALVDTLGDASDVLADAELHPDDDADALATVEAAVADLADAVEDAEEWDDLSVREKLRAQGFYDVLGEKHKDFPPEWSALKEWEQRDDVEMILLALDMMDSEFMERHCLEALERMGHSGAVDAMLARAERRDKPAIRVLGTTGEAREDVLETLHEFLDGDPVLQRTTLRALGQIGSEESTQPVADLLAADEESVRSQAARALGLIGDPRAADPLANMLDDEAETDSVRASAAWALVQIGTERALDAAANHDDDDAYVVQAEAEPAADALDAAAAR